MKYVLIAAGAIVLLALAVTLLGTLAPRDHETALAREIAAPPAAVYRLVRDYEAYPAWRTGVKAMHADGADRYIEESGHGRIPYRLLDDRPGERLVARIDDPTLPFSGSWTFEIAPQGAGSLLRITERGSVPNPVMRFFSTYVFSHERTIRTYLDDAARRLGN